METLVSAKGQILETRNLLALDIPTDSAWYHYDVIDGNETYSLDVGKPLVYVKWKQQTITVIPRPGVSAAVAIGGRIQVYTGEASKEKPFDIESGCCAPYPVEARGVNLLNTVGSVIQSNGRVDMRGFNQAYVRPRFPAFQNPEWQILLNGISQNIEFFPVLGPAIMVDAFIDLTATPTFELPTELVFLYDSSTTAPINLGQPIWEVSRHYKNV